MYPKLNAGQLTSTIAHEGKDGTMISFLNQALADRHLKRIFVGTTVMFALLYAAEKSKPYLCKLVDKIKEKTQKKAKKGDYNEQI